jgi:hypothetical protein
LTPGEPYRLVFVTADTYTAPSTSISYYNGVVNAEADSVAALEVLKTTWLGIGSTSTVNAIDNTGADPGVPIYDLNGDLIAADATTGTNGLFSGSLLQPISYDEINASPENYYVWTGTTTAGAEDL